MALLPEEFGIYSARVTNVVNVLESVARGGKIWQRAIAGQRWDITLESSLLLPDDADIAYAFLVARQIDGDSIQLKLPRYSFSDVPTKTTALSATVGELSVSVTNGSNMVVGKYFTFSNHSKVYLVTGVSGNLISFAPRLISDVPSGSTMSFNDVQFNMIVRQRPQRFEVDADSDSVRLQVDLSEAI